MVDNINLSITQRNRRLMEGLPIGVMSTDITGRISAASPLACQILGLSEQRLLGMRLGELEGVAPQPSHILVEFPAQSDPRRRDPRQRRGDHE